MKTGPGTNLSGFVGLCCAILLTISSVYAQDGPRMHAGILEGVGDAWQTVTLPNDYAEMVVVGVPAYEASQLPAVVRIRNAEANTFDVRVQNPSGEALDGYMVHYVAVEAGVYTLEEHGVQLEAATIPIESVDHAGRWNGETIGYTNDYVSPVVLGQVMSFNDERWSVFWSRGVLATAPPGQLPRIGRHVGEDEIIERAEETIGYIVLESGFWDVHGYRFQAFMGEDIIEGIDNADLYAYEHGIEDPSVVMLSAAGMDGVNGGWPVLLGKSGLAGDQVRLAIDEDQISDPERLHTSEQVAVLVLQSTRVLPQISTFMPQRGEAGTRVSLFGGALSEVSTIYFGDIQASLIELVQDGELRVDVPEGAETGVIRLFDAEGVEVTSTERFVVTFGEAAPGINLCRLTKAVSSQSSLETPVTGSEKACDGILDGTLASETIAATTFEDQSWWEVDLGGIYNISEVGVVNRTDCCQEALGDFFVFVSDFPFLSESIQVTLAEPGVRAFFVGAVQEEAAVPVGQQGRYVRLQYPGAGALGVSEIEIIAADGQVIEVDNEDESQVPLTLELQAPFPSPVKDRGTVVYHLDASGPVRLVIHDMLGREIAELVDEVKPAGEHSVNFHADDLASGVYGLRLYAGRRVLSAVMVVHH